MKIIAMLNFYDEQPEYLHRAIQSIRWLGADVLVACDGAYELFDGGPSSPPEQHAAIIKAAHDMDIDLCIPARPWQGNEVEKRQFMLERALIHAADSDWLMIFDADWCLHYLHGTTKAALASLAHDHLAAEAAIFTRHAVDGSINENPAMEPLRIFLRAHQGMEIIENHYTYLYPHGEQVLMVSRDLDSDPGSIASLTSYIGLSHETWGRPRERRQKQIKYYQRREELGVENQKLPAI